MDRLKEPMLVSINHGNTGTVIHFKGCSMKCHWCLHPELISPDLEIVWYRENCIACGECVYGCPQGAIILNDSNLYRENTNCALCLNCVEICPSLVFRAVGERRSCTQIIEQIKAHLPPHGQTAHEVLFTGGEPLLQPAALINLLDECGKFLIRRIVNTSGFVPTKVLLEVAKRTDLFLYTLWHMDSVRHKHMTGQPNELSLHNLRELTAAGAAVQTRLFLIKGMNDSTENIEATGAFLAKLGNINAIQLLSLEDLPQPIADHETNTTLGLQHLIPEVRRFLEVQAIFEEYGLQTTSKVE